jgi:phosphonate ABC transporter permease subunit PhnE
MIFAYGFQVTQVDLEETRSERRQAQLIRILRALAQPDLVEYTEEEFIVSSPVWMACPEGGLEAPPPDTSGPYIVLTPACGDPKDEISVQGFNFEPNTQGPINFIPPSGVTIQLGNVQTDNEGNFSTVVELPNRQPVAEAQEIRTITRRSVGSPQLTRSAHETWDKIIETVFMAFLATVLGVGVGIPLSFFAARNLMKDVKSSVARAALSIIAWPIGIALGAALARGIGEISAMLSDNFALSLGGLVLLPAFVWGSTRWTFPQTEGGRPTLPVRLGRLLILAASAFALILALYLLSWAMLSVGNALAPRMGRFDFLGEFIADLGDILGMMIVVVTALVGGGLVSNLAGKGWIVLGKTLTTPARQAATFTFAAAAGAVLFLLFLAAISWLYQSEELMVSLLMPISIIGIISLVYSIATRKIDLGTGVLGVLLYALFAAGLASDQITRIGNPRIVTAAFGVISGLVFALANRKVDELPTGLVTYYIARTILNVLRAIEPLILVIVAAVWVGLGPFAGVLALALHSVAALAKLYSEQVESILPGPIEAVKAVGATRLQTVRYAVIPQIIPPYIAFTMYRWDINVRMSTIIGFAGGGGVGSLLQQNINLLNYRAAAVQMLAIALVVALMDYASSKLRERVV